MTIMDIVKANQEIEKGNHNGALFFMTANVLSSSGHHIDKVTGKHTLSNAIAELNEYGLENIVEVHLQREI